MTNIENHFIYIKLISKNAHSSSAKWAFLRNEETYPQYARFIKKQLTAPHGFGDCRNPQVLYTQKAGKDA